MKLDPDIQTRHYLYNISYNYRERLVGLFVFTAFIIFSVLLVMSGKSQHMFERRVTYYMDVASSEGISQGSIIKALGAEIGAVSALNLTSDSKIRVTIEVYESSQPLIRVGAKVIVNRLTNIRDALIEIKSDSIGTPMLADGSIIPVEETPSLNDLLLGIASIIQSADKQDLLAKFETVLPKLELTIENAHKIIAQIATGHGVLGAAVFDKKVEKELKVVVTSGADILQEAEGIISIAKQRLRQIEPVLEDAKFVTADLRRAAQDLPTMIVDLNVIIKQANAALILINKELEDVPGTVTEVRRVISKTDHLIDSTQNTWPLSNDIEKKSPHQLIPAHSSHE